ncbi:MAG: hypothetical protein IMF19_14250 [Proteobacteria bacterium]|nr:hypothetical protein [Pseudomonadota bacterium]
MSIIKELAKKACTQLGCHKDSFCFGGRGAAKGMCIAAITRYNELRHAELKDEAAPWR